MEDLKPHELRMDGYVPWDELEALKAPVTPEQALQKPPGLSPSTTGEINRSVGFVPWEELRARTVPLPAFVPRTKDYHDSVAVTRLSFKEALAKHPAIEANHDLSRELDNLTYRMAGQLEGALADERRPLVDTAIKEWIESLTPERFISNDLLQSLLDANETIRQAILAVRKQFPQLTETELGFDLEDIAFDMAETLAGMPGSERKRMVDEVIANWIESLPSEVRRKLEAATSPSGCTGMLAKPRVIMSSASLSMEDINRMVGHVPWDEIKARTEDITPEQVRKKLI